MRGSREITTGLGGRLVLRRGWMSCEYVRYPVSWVALGGVTEIVRVAHMVQKLATDLLRLSFLEGG
jgi:hypothetical protein